MNSSGKSTGARCTCLQSKKTCVPKNSSGSRAAGCPCLTNKKVPKPTTSSVRNNSSVSTIRSQTTGPLEEVQETIDRIRKQIASNANNIESLIQSLKDTCTKYPQVYNHSEMSSLFSNNTASKLQDSSTFQQRPSLTRPTSTSVNQSTSRSNQTTKKNLPDSKSSVNQSNKNKSKQSSKDESSISMSKYSKTDIPTSTKISHHSTGISKSINISSTSNTLSKTNTILNEQSRKQGNSTSTSIMLSKTNSLVKEQTRKQEDSIVEKSFVFINNTFEETSVFENGGLTRSSLEIPHTLSRSKSLSPGCKGTTTKEVTLNKNGKSNVSSLQVHSHQLSTAKNLSKSASNISLQNTSNPIPFQGKTQMTFTLNIDFDDKINSGQNPGGLARVSIRGEQRW